MLGSAPQPDVYLALTPERGGQSQLSGEFGLGAPELAVEICVTSTEVDFGPKLALYQRAGVQEYITVESFTKRIVWRVLQNGSYREIDVDPDGSLRSMVFPGLWLDTSAFWKREGAAITALLQRGLASEEHAAFVQRLQASHKG